MRNDRTRALGVPLRTRKFRGQIRIGVVTHGFRVIWADRATTRCGIRYTHKEYLVDNDTRLATRTSRGVDCMACLASEADR